MIWKASLILCLTSCVLSYTRPAISEQKIQRFHHGDLKHIGHHEPEHHDVYAWAYPSYEFSYYVEDPHTHDFKGQHEIRDGDKVTGKYWLMQPDGRKRTVNYRSDHKEGFRAEVNYVPHEGHHPQHYEVNEHHPEVREHHHEEREYHPEIKEHSDDHHNNYHSKNILLKSIVDRKSHQQDDDRDNNENHGKSWGWIRPRLDHKYGHDDRKDAIRGIGREHGHSEHWKNGNLVGWREGRDRNDDEDREDRRNDRYDHHSHRNYHNRDMDTHRRHEDRRNIKLFVPYGHRLH